MADRTELFREYIEAKIKADEAINIVSALKIQLVDSMIEDKNKSSIIVLSPDDSYKVTLVEGSRLIIDEDRLHKKLNAAQWKSVTKSVMDRGLLENAINAGDVDAQVVAEASTEIANAPYIKVTPVKNTEKAAGGGGGLDAVRSAVRKGRKPSAAARKLPKKKVRK